MSREDKFTFTNFFEERAHQPLFVEKPAPVSVSIASTKHDFNVHVPESHAAEKRKAMEMSTGLYATQVPLWKKLPAWVPIMCWIATSSTVILWNAYILRDLKFAHPVALTTVHLLFQTVATRLLRRFSSLINGAKDLESSGQMTRDAYLKKIVPIGLLFSLSLVLSNWVYLRLTVSFIQMIKAFTPVSVLFVSFAMKIKEPSRQIMTIVVMISLGVAIASYGEIQFELVGFLVQVFAIGIESTRLVLVQILLQGMGMSPLVSLYYFAPICLLFNVLILLPVEGTAVFANALQLVGLPMLLGNACMTFALNLSSVWLIGKASGLVLTLAGVLKDILLISGSWAILGSRITGIQCFGYAIALTGLVLFKTQK